MGGMNLYPEFFANYDGRSMTSKPELKKWPWNIGVLEYWNNGYKTG